MKKLAIVVPTYNEKDNLPILLQLISETVKELGNLAVNVIVVDDNSPDGTGDVAESLGLQIKRENFEIITLHRAEKDGLGRAYVAGFRRAVELGADLICELDADLSHPVAKIPELVAAAEKYDLVMGSRYVKGGGVKNWSIFRQILSRAGSLYARLILGININDFTGGYNLFHTKVLEKVNVDSINASGYGFQIELKYRIIKSGHTFTEVPIIFVDRVQGQSKMSSKIIFEALGLVLKLRFGN